VKKKYLLNELILATQEVVIRRIEIQSQPGKWFTRPHLENLSQKKVGGVAQGVGPEFKRQYPKKRNNLIPPS
jgi:hypothetical protein